MKRIKRMKRMKNKTVNIYELKVHLEYYKKIE